MCTKLTDAKRHKLKITKFMFWLYSQACHFEIPHVTAVASIHLTLSIHVYHQCFLLFSRKEDYTGKSFELHKSNLPNLSKMQFVKVMKTSDY